MPYIPNTDADRAAMLKTIGARSVEELFHDVPAALRFPELELPEPVSEPEILSELRALGDCNIDLDHAASFLGAGAYRHFVPSVVGHVVGRSEFYTAYTPYQPEISQGTLQTMFEYQSMICALTGMDASNASHYDGATSLAEAVIVAVNTARGKRRKVVFPASVHPEYRAVVRTYTQGMGLTVTGDEGTVADVHALMGMMDAETACVVVQNPNFLGEMEDPTALRALAEAAHAAGAMFIVSADPISLGLFKAPADYGADIVCGEGQALGGGLNFGGPYLGYFACKKQYVHKIAGRIVGQTVDQNGERGFVLTLSAREQHIRREKATSNICSNEALMALAAGVYMTALGKQGLRHVAELCYHKAHYAANEMAKLAGYQVLAEGPGASRGGRPFFKEFMLRCPKPIAEVNDYLLREWGLVGGYDLGQDYPDLVDTMLICVTELNTKAEIDMLAEALEGLTQPANETGMEDNA